MNTGADITLSAVLARYEREHRQATKLIYLATSGIVSLYTNDSVPAKIARRVLLRVANHMVPIKSMMMAKLTEKDQADRGLGIPTPLSMARHLLRAAA
ncbi:MAG: hypothetical protein U1E36_02525 [Rickettsiales bacterium]